jgi:hypothetical protein
MDLSSRNRWLPRALPATPQRALHSIVVLAFAADIRTAELTEGQAHKKRALNVAFTLGVPSGRLEMSDAKKCDASSCSPPASMRSAENKRGARVA